MKTLPFVFGQFTIGNFSRAAVKSKETQYATAKYHCRSISFLRFISSVISEPKLLTSNFLDSLNL